MKWYIASVMKKSKKQKKTKCTHAWTVLRRGGNPWIEEVYVVEGCITCKKERFRDPTKEDIEEEKKNHVCPLCRFGHTPADPFGVKVEDCLRAMSERIQKLEEEVEDLQSDNRTTTSFIRSKMPLGPTRGHW